MTQLDDLAQVAEELRKLRVDAYQEFVYGPHGGVEGLSLGDDFYPLWELTLAANREALERADFEAIRARRGPDWSVERPTRGKSA
jgi:hypothetical protein